jgi:tetratricopeptide (TPR) repeat protein
VASPVAPIEVATADSAPRYVAFISYTHEDRKWAEWLHTALERFVVPRRIRGETRIALSARGRIAPVFLDRVELAASNDLESSIRRALDSAGCLIVIGSPAAARAPRVTEEIRAFKRVRPERPVFSLVVAGRPNAAKRGFPETEECFPLGLRRYVDPDGEITGEEREPLAADVRAGRDGRRTALLRLIAGVLGVNFDALARRDAQRRVRRFAILAAAALGGMAVTSALAINAVIARNEANRQRQRAEEQSETARITADFLADVFQSPTPEKSLGRPIEARELLERGAQRLKRSLAGKPEIQAGLTMQIGRAYRLLGTYDRAEPLLHEAVDWYDQPAHRSSSNYELSLTELGKYYSDVGRYAEAQRTLNRAIRVGSIQPLASRHVDALLSYAAVETQRNEMPDALEALNQVGAILHARNSDGADDVRLRERYLNVYRIKGDYPTAEKYALEAVSAAERLFGAQSDETLAAYTQVSLLYQEMGDLKKADVYAQKEVAATEQIYGSEHPMLATALLNYAIVLAENDDMTRSGPLFRRALAIRLKSLGPDNYNTAVAYDNLAQFLVDSGEATEALSMVRHSEAIYTAVEGPTHPDVAYALKLQALILLKLGRPAEARPVADRALAINEAAYGQVHPQVARALLQVGRVSLAQRRDADAVRELARAVQIGDSVWGAQAVQMDDILESYALALKKNDQQVESLAVTKRLNAMLAARHPAGK